MWMNYTHNACSVTNPPSYYNKDCQQLTQILENQNNQHRSKRRTSSNHKMFRHALLHEHDHEKKQQNEPSMETEIVDSNGALITKCYSQSTESSVGW